MNNLGAMVKQYNRFIEDLSIMSNDISELLTNEFKLDYVAGYWSPRDRSAWSSKQRFCSWYKNSKQIIYSCIDLITDVPYLQLLRCNVNLENAKFEDFSETDGFAHTDNVKIEKIEAPEFYYSFNQDWGKCCFCKIDLLSITSNEVINTDIKKIFSILLNNDFNDIKLKSVVFIQN